jgi:hypothetical protein
MTDRERIDEIRKLNGEGWYKASGDVKFLLAQIDKRDAALKDIRDNYDCECVAGTRTVGAVHCQSCVAREALGEE